MSGAPPTAVASTVLAIHVRPLVAAALDLLPMTLLVVGAGIRETRLLVLGVLVVGTILGGRLHVARWPAWAAALPVSISLAWGLLPLPPDGLDGTTCASPLAPLATYRVIEAGLALAAVALLARWLGGGGKELGLTLPQRRHRALGLAAFAACGPLGIAIGPALSAPFFGPIALDTGELGAWIPALAFGLANGTMEEVLYRGSLRAWTARVTGPWPAIVGQAIVFGIAHTGPDVGGSPLVVALALFAGGLIAGVVVRRTGSLFLPIAVHAGLDVPLYFGNACRIV